MVYKRKKDCKCYRGDVPCAPHKETGGFCNNCASQTTGRVLVIKLGAAGDVIRMNKFRRFRSDKPLKYAKM